LVRLADKIDWQQFEKSLHPTCVPGKGAPASRTRLMVPQQYDSDANFEFPKPCPRVARSC
jgi:hypothetical protein